MCDYGRYSHMDTQSPFTRQKEEVDKMGMFYGDEPTWTSAQTQASIRAQEAMSATDPEAPGGTGGEGMTPDELKRRMPLWHDFGPFTYENMPGRELNEYLAKQRASDWVAFAKLVREMLGPEEPLMADLVAVYERGTALADALEAAAQEEEAT